MPSTKKNKMVKTASSPTKSNARSPKLPFKMRKTSSPGRPRNKNSVIIKLAKIQEYALGAHIVYRVRTNRGPYAEHFLWTASRDPQPDWARPLHLDTDRYFFHKENEIQKHYDGSEYHIRYFFLEMSPDTTNEEELEQELRRLAQYIADNINAQFDPTRGTAGFVVVPEDFNELFWNHDAVVSDLIGTEGSIKKIKAYLGEDWTGSFEENSHVIHAFFRKKKIPRSIQQYLNAPDSEVTDD